MSRSPREVDNNNYCLLYFNANIMCSFTKKPKLLGDFVSQTSYWGSGTQLGDFRPSDPIFFHVSPNNPVRSTPLDIHKSCRGPNTPGRQVLWSGYTYTHSCFISTILLHSNNNTDTCTKYQHDYMKQYLAYELKNITILQLQCFQWSVICQIKYCLRPKGHPYELPRCEYELYKKSFIPRCLYRNC